MQHPGEDIFLSTHQLTIGYALVAKEYKIIQRNLHLQLKAGQLVCLLGPNGSGKSTLLRTLAGLQKPVGGKVTVLQKDLQFLSNLQRARKISMVLTERNEISSLSVYEAISLGRFPYSDWLGNLQPNDRQKIEEAIAITGTEAFLDKKLHQLSDGERQKVMIARALAQDTPIILLDEPTAHIDITGRVMLFALLKKLTQEVKKAILVSTHDLELALQTADQLWLMHNKNHFRKGLPEELILNGALQHTFAQEGFLLDKQSGNFYFNFNENQNLIKLPVYLSGDEFLKKWTAKALEKQGFIVSKDIKSPVWVSISQAEKQITWRALVNGIEKKSHHLEELIEWMKGQL